MVHITMEFCGDGMVSYLFVRLGVVYQCRLTDGGGAWSRDKLQVRLDTKQGGTIIVIGNMEDVGEADG